MLRFRSSLQVPAELVSRGCDVIVLSNYVDSYLFVRSPASAGIVNIDMSAASRIPQNLTLPPNPRKLYNSPLGFLLGVSLLAVKRGGHEDILAYNPSATSSDQQLHPAGPEIINARQQDDQTAPSGGSGNQPSGSTGRAGQQYRGVTGSWGSGDAVYDSGILHGKSVYHDQVIAPPSPPGSDTDRDDPSTPFPPPSSFSKDRSSRAKAVTVPTALELESYKFRQVPIPTPEHSPETKETMVDAVSPAPLHLSLSYWQAMLS